MSGPTIAAVLCTRNRPDDVRRGMPTLLSTDADMIIIVDQSTEPSTRQVLDEVGAFDDHRVQYVASGERGVSRARNRAIEVCSTDLMAFTDDDCTVPPSWVHDIRKLMADQHYDLMFAPVVAPTDRDGLEGWIPEYLPSATGQVAVDCDPVGAFGFTANMAMTSELASAIGPFDEWLGPGSEHNIGGEDTDLGYRALRAGFAVGVEASPAVTHYGARSGAAFDTTRTTYQRGTGAFLDKHRRLGDAAARHPRARRAGSSAARGGRQRGPAAPPLRARCRPVVPGRHRHGPMPLHGRPGHQALRPPLTTAVRSARSPCCRRATGRSGRPSR